MKNTIIASSVTLLIGLLVGYGIWGYTDRNVNMDTMMRTPSSSMQHDMDMKGNRPQASMDTMMMDMMAGLAGKTGDVYDKEFIAEMVIHHEGAVMMAQSALQNAQHQEIKDLATAIIQAQNKEITDMKAWYKKWYGVDLK